MAATWENVAFVMCAVRSESSLSAWRNFTSLAIQHALSKDSDQTTQMHRLTGIFARHTFPEGTFSDVATHMTWSVTCTGCPQRSHDVVKTSIQRWWINVESTLFPRFVPAGLNFYISANICLHMRGCSVVCVGGGGLGGMGGGRGRSRCVWTRPSIKHFKIMHVFLLKVLYTALILAPYLKFKQYFICIILYRKYKPERSIYIIYTKGIQKKVIWLI